MASTIRAASTSGLVSKLGPLAAVLVGLTALPACGSDSEPSDPGTNEAGSSGSGNPSGGVINALNPTADRLSLTIDGTPTGKTYEAGSTNVFGSYILLRFEDAATDETAVELGFTDAVSTGTYPLEESEFQLGSTEARVAIAIRLDGDAQDRYVDGSITLETFEREDPADPFSLIEGSFEGTIMTADGSATVEGEFVRESTCRANPGASAFGC